MDRLSGSEKYAIAAAILLLFVAMLNNAVVTLAVSVFGLVAGLLVARTTSLHRAGLVGLVGFGIAAVVGLAMLLQR
jgi:hypothetical protein